MPNIQSMTGFGSADNGVFSIEIRSVNHRFFDAFFRMPSFLNKYEIDMRKRLKREFLRGRFDVNIQTNPEVTQAVKVNSGLVSEFVKSLNEIKDAFSVSGDVTLDMLAGFKEIFVTDTVELNEQELISTFDKCIAMLYDMRVKEGGNLKKELLAILDVVKGHLEGIIQEADNLNERLKERFLDRVRSLLADVTVDEGRLIQEASLLAEKSDITEEITRLQSHIEQFQEILDSEEAVGRKLDFLLQEFLREANTIASKTSEYGIISNIVDMKNEIEKLREQVQNIQ